MPVDRLDFGGGSTTRAILADSHPSHHPRKTSRSVFRVSESAWVCVTIKMTAHTTAQPMLYAV